MSISLPIFKKFSAIISLSNLSVHFSLSSPSGSPVIHRLFLLMVSYSSCRLSSLVFILFNLFSFDWIVSNDLSSSSDFLSSACSSLLLLLSVAFFFSFHSLYFSAPEFVFFYDFYLCVIAFLSLLFM